MPNWCRNELTVTHDYDSEAATIERENFKNMIKIAQRDPEKTGLFQQTIPMPAILEGTIFSPSQTTPEARAHSDRAFSETGYRDWYAWRLENWGTKWDAVDIEIAWDEYILEVAFSTAWDPPEPWLDKMRELFPNLGFTMFYREDNMQLAGYL